MKDSYSLENLIEKDYELYLFIRNYVLELCGDYCVKDTSEDYIELDLSDNYRNVLENYLEEMDNE